MSISAALADQPIAGVNASVSMMTKGGLNTVTQSLAIEYAKDGIRFNAVAPGVVDTPLHKDIQGTLKTLQPMGKIVAIRMLSTPCSTWQSRSSHRGGAPRGRWLSRWPLVNPSSGRPGDFDVSSL